MKIIEEYVKKTKCLIKKLNNKVGQLKHKAARLERQLANGRGAH